MDISSYARSEFQKDQSYWSSTYLKSKQDIYFLSDADDAQWDSKVLQERRDSGRPCLTIDQLGQFVHQVVNDIKMNTPAINIIPSGGDATVKVANIYKGLIRNIEYESKADDVYDNAVTFSVKGGIGFIRIDHEYADEEGFEQKLVFKRVINPLAVFMDRNSKEPDGSDAKHCTILESMSVGEFKRRWPNASISDFQAGDANREYKDEDTITVAEFFCIKENDEKVGLTELGEVESYNKKKSYKSWRMRKKRKVHRYWLSGSEILEETTFPGKYIPIVPVMGEEEWLDGKRNLLSLIRKSKDAQMMFNVWKSSETEVIMKQPQAPIQAAAGTTENYASDYKNPSKTSVLRYDLLTVNGQKINVPPQRLAPPQLPAGFVGAAASAVDDIKATMGMYNASLGQRSNEQSGKAILARQHEGDVATYHFGDNLNRSIAQCGRICVWAIPEIYDTDRIIQVVDEEDNTKDVGLYSARVEGQEEEYDLSKGRYSVRVVTGPSFSTKRQETIAALTELFRANPELMASFGDIYFKNSDFNGAEAMAKRAKKLINPALLEEEERAELEQPDPEKEKMKVIIEQGAKEIQTLQQQLQNKQADIQLKQMDLAIKGQETQQKSEELEFKKVEAAAKFQYENKKLEADTLTARYNAKASASPDVVLTDPDLHEAGISPMEAIMATLTASIQQQSEVIGNGLVQLGQAQVMLSQTIAQGNAMLTKSINKPKQVVYDNDGRILGVK